MANLTGKLHQSRILGRFFHTLDDCLQRELKDCATVLDLGCGPSSPLQYCRNVKYSVGVEAFDDYLKKSKKQKIHSKYIKSRIEDLEFPDKSFDAVIMIEVLEHLPTKTGVKMLSKAEKWAKKKLIVSSPNGFVAQKALDSNSLQKHLSGWDLGKMKKLGFKSRGLAGLKSLRQEVQSNSMLTGDLTASMKYHPRFFWFLVATLSQLFIYYRPKNGFELFNVKIISGSRRRR